MTNLQENQVDPTSKLAINCRNCIHCDISPRGSDLDKCLKTGGAYCEFVHSFPSSYGYICNKYSAWTPRKMRITELIFDKIRKMLTSI